MSTEPVESNKIAVSISNFLGGGVAQSDLYILMKSGKFVKIAKKGSEFNKDRLENYKDQNVEHFYIDSEDYKEYLDKTVKILDVLDHADLDEEKKFAVVKGATESVLTSLESFEIEESTLTQAQTVTRSMVSALGNVGRLNNVIAELTSMNSLFIKHAATTSAMAISIAQQMDWSGEATLNTIGFAALVHDIGKKEFPPEMMYKSRIDMTPDETKLYERHPEIGMQILSGLNMPTQILSIVYEHHESPGGRGFPRGLKRSQIFPLSRIVSMADKLAHELFDDRGEKKAQSMEEAIFKIKEVHEHSFDNVFWRALQGILRQL